MRSFYMSNFHSEHYVEVRYPVKRTHIEHTLRARAYTNFQAVYTGNCENSKLQTLPR